MTRMKFTRISFLRVILIVMMSAIVLRLFLVQIIEHNYWSEKADAQHTLESTIVAERGDIYMMDGDEPVVVVMNETVYTVIVDPMLANEDETVAVVEKYAKDYVVAEWKDVFSDKLRRYYIVAKNVPRKIAEQLEENLPAGMWFQENNKRVYAEGEMASGLLGFVNADGIGQYGVEGAFNDDLSGVNGRLKTIADVNNVALSIGDDNIKIPAVDGKNIVLTVDRNIQSKAEKILRDELEKLNVKNGSALVVNPQTGEVLAMANIPTYDPADYGMVESAASYKNTIVADAFEPASVCKPFAFAAAIDQGVMTPETTYYNTDKVYVDGWPIENATKGKTGNITMQTALSWSLNTGSIQALRLLGGSSTEITYDGKQKLFDYYYNKFGLGQITGVELAESAGIIYSPDSYDATDARYANMTFGQGMTTTMMQVMAAFSSLINGGNYYTPTIIAGEIKNGEFVAAEQQVPVRRTISEETSKTMRQMLRTARQTYISARTSDIGYFIGGKTGTAQAVSDSGYTFDETIGTYIGFGATSVEELPEYAIMVKIWEEGKTLAGSEAKEVFDALNGYMINYLKIKPKG